MRNGVVVDGEVAVFSGVRNLRFINRFGGETVKARRCYKYVNKGAAILGEPTNGVGSEVFSEPWVYG